MIAVAGGAEGIGRATVERVSELGARVLIGDLREAEAHDAAQGLSGDAAGVALDVTDPASCASFLAQANERFGPVDIVITRAGVMWVGPFAEEPHRVTAR